MMNACKIRIGSKFYSNSFASFNCINVVQGRIRGIHIFPELKSDGSSCLMFCLFPQTPNTSLVSRISCNLGFSEISNLTFRNEGKESSHVLGIESCILFCVMMCSAFL